ncbi:MAG: hypothetical protein ACI9BW_002138 [Gammaproteobacteria bacterium]|jgi:hypothetical protein
MSSEAIAADRVGALRDCLAVLANSSDGETLATHSMMTTPERALRTETDAKPMLAPAAVF